MSRHKSRGWRGQYDRVKRWHRLVQEIGKQRATATDTEQQHDFCCKRAMSEAATVAIG